ncbi:gp20 [Mycobacterium phage Ardmore]|uniref:Gp20 n=1 Tax=Mycobacterium phage Ardmore TaxID=2902838 RepID=D4N7G5_9CAUD|nr:minor tail protein [Mycobacterium phage Ardmore]ACY39902.1 gp20 [Mycobacterium phage Ardmore]
MSVAVGWWAESHVSFGVTLTPEVGFHYGGPKQEFGVTIAPEIGMSAVAHSRVGFGLSVPVSLGMGAASHSKASFGLVFAPYIAMRGPAAFEPVFPSEDLYPSVSLFPTPRAQSPGFGLSFTPSLGFEAAPKFVRSFGIELDPQVGMGTALGFTKGFGLELSPQVGMSGAERYYREFELTFAPEIGMDAVGNDGVDPVAFDAASAVNAGTADFTYSHTATAGAAVVVAVVLTGAGGSMVSVTYGGVAMTSVGSVDLDNTAAQGTLFLYFINDVPGGAQTIAIDKGGFTWCRSAAVSYLNVGSYGAFNSAYGSGTTVSHPATSVAGGMVVQALGVRNNVTITPSGGTTRANASNTGGSMSMSDSTSSTTFAATLASSNTWASAYIVLNPA